MRSLERRARQINWPWPRRWSRKWPCPSAVLVSICVWGLVAAWSGSVQAQSPPAQSAREAERQRLLDQLGLKKRAAPVAPPPQAPGDSEAKEKEEAPAAEEGTPEAPPGAPPSARAAIVFSGRVHTALLGACQSCHIASGVAGRSAYVLDGTLDTDFGATRRHVNVAQPEQSPLVRLAAGVGHAGGAVFPSASAGQQLLLRWIGDGAKRGGGAPGAPPVPAPAPVSSVPAAPKVDAGRSAASAPPSAPPVPVAPLPAAVGPAAPVAASPPQLAYAPTLHEALHAACGGCHRAGGVASGTGYVLSGDVTADFASARRWVDLERPEASPLLGKASGASHAGGAIYPPGSEDYARLLQWIQFGAAGPTEIAANPGSETPLAAPAPRAPAPDAPAVPAHVPASAPPSDGLRLPFAFRLNGRFDLNYERRNFDTQPFSSGDHALQSYHHFVFLSRQTQDDPVGFSAELINLTFWEVSYRLSLPESVGPLWIKIGKLLVPFGPDPLFHQSYGGLVGFDQRVLPPIWAQEGVSGRFSKEQGDFSGSVDVYGVRGHELRQPDGVLNLQSDLSPVDSVQIAAGGRLSASWNAVSLFYSAYVNGLGFGRTLYLQAADLAIWRLRGVPVLEDLAAELGLLRGDVSGAGPGQDYYHFASYFRLRYFLTDVTYLQYRQGLRTFNNRRGVILDDTRLTREDGSTHNFGLVTRLGPLTFGLSYFFILEKADEVDDDFLRVTSVYEF